MKIDTDASVKSRIVDLLRYKAERGQRSLDFDGPPAPPRPRLAVVRPFRALTARELAHREQMVRHLEGQRSEVKGQR
jgi:hypothetical protein